MSVTAAVILDAALPYILAGMRMLQLREQAKAGVTITQEQLDAAKQITDDVVGDANAAVAALPDDEPEPAPQ